MSNENISPYWKHFAIGQYLRVVDQDRVEGTITVMDVWRPTEATEHNADRVFRITLKVVGSEEFDRE